MADIHAGAAHFRFEQSEYMRLCELAAKYQTDLATILRIGGTLMIEADRRGLLKIALSDPAAMLRKGD